jgi:hypothetical protein
VVKVLLFVSFHHSFGDLLCSFSILYSTILAVSKQRARGVPGPCQQGGTINLEYLMSYGFIDLQFLVCVSIIFHLFA